jgi:hypothetical protein
MTTTTETQVSSPTLETSRWRLSRVLVAFIVGVLLVAIAAVGTILAYEQSYTGKVAAGVSIGGVEVAGLTRDEAAAKVKASFASVGTGAFTLQAATGDTTLTYAQLGRRADVDAMLDEAFAVGRTGNPLERVVEEAKGRGRGQPARARRQRGRVRRVPGEGAVEAPGDQGSASSEVNVTMPYRNGGSRSGSNASPYPGVPSEATRTSPPSIRSRASSSPPR